MVDAFAEPNPHSLSVVLAGEKKKKTGDDRIHTLFANPELVRALGPSNRLC